MTISAIAGEIAIAPQYAKYDDGYVPGARARGKVTLNANPSDADTIQIGTAVYVFKNALAAQWQVKIGATKELTIANLADAVKGVKATSGSAYYTTTIPNLLVTVDGEANVLYVVSYLKGQAGNTVALIKSGADIVVSAATLLGGIDGGKIEAAVGRISFSGNPVADDSFAVGIDTFTWKVASGSAVQITIGADKWESIVNAAVKVNAKIDATATADDGQLDLVSAASGAVGNTTILTETSTATTCTGSGTFSTGQSLEVYDRTTLTWERIPVTDTDYDFAQMQAIAPPEIKHVVVPNGAYKTGVTVGGGANMLPRMQTSLGILLLGALGAAGTPGSLGSGCYTHAFTFAATDATYQPWLAVRKMIPGRSSPYAEGRGLYGWDNKIAALSLAIAAAQPVGASVQFVGRVPERVLHPEAWAGSTFEDFGGVPLACKGTFKLPTIPDFPVPLPVTAVTIDLGNAVTGPREEFIVGSYFMDDILTRLRSVSLRFIYKWSDPYLSDYLFGNAKRATAWDPTPFKTTTSGSNYAFDLTVQSAINIPGSSTPYSLRVRGNSVTWEIGSPVRLRGGDIIMMDVRGTLLDPASGEYVEFILTNGQSSQYAIPSEP